MIDVTKGVLTPFQIYDSLLKQNRFITGREFSLIAPHDRFLPFMFMRDSSSDDLAEIRVKDLSGATVLTVNESNVSREILKNDLVSKDWFIYYGGIVTGMNLSCDDYYLEIEDAGANIWYSEVFRAYDDLSPFIKLEYSSQFDVENLIYQSGYVNRVYFNTFIGEPEPTIEEEGSNDGNDNFVPTFQKAILTHKFKLDMIPEYLVKALNQIRMHSSKSIVYANRAYDLFDDFEFSGAWVDEDFFQGEINFKTFETVKTECNDNLTFYELVAGPGPNSAPVASNLSVYGVPILGSFLGLNYDYSDVDGDLEGATTFQWFRSDDAIGTGKAAISGATFQEYILVDDDVNKFVSCEVTPVAATGTSPGATVESERKQINPSKPLPSENFTTLISNGNPLILFPGQAIGVFVKLSQNIVGAGTVTMKLTGPSVQSDQVDNKLTLNFADGELTKIGQFDNVYHTQALNVDAVVTIISVTGNITVGTIDSFSIEIAAGVAPP